MGRKRDSRSERQPSTGSGDMTITTLLDEQACTFVVDWSEFWNISIAVLIGVAPPVAASLLAYFFNERSKRRQFKVDRDTDRRSFEREKKYDKTREGYELVLSSLRRAQFDEEFERTSIDNRSLKWHPGKHKAKLTKEQIEDANACLQGIPKLMFYDDAFDLQEILDSLEHKPDVLADLRARLDILLARMDARRIHDVYLPFECTLASLTLLEVPVSVVDMSRELMLDLLSNNHMMKPESTIPKIQCMMQNHLQQLAGSAQQLANVNTDLGIVKLEMRPIPYATVSVKKPSESAETIKSPDKNEP